MASATDNFNRASLGSNWTLALNTVVTNASATFTGNTLNAHSLAYWSADTFGPEQFSQAKVSVLATPSRMGPGVRISTNNGYYISASVDQTRVFKIVSGTATQLGSDYTAAAANDILRIVVSGSLLYIYQAGVLLAQISDTALTSGSPGIGTYNNSADSRGDDWEGGDLIYTPQRMRRRT